MLVKLLGGLYLTPNGVRFLFSLPPNRLGVATVLIGYSLKLLQELLLMQQLEDLYNPRINLLRRWNSMSNLARQVRWVRLKKQCMQLQLEMRHQYPQLTLQAIRAINIKQVNPSRISLLMVDIKICSHPIVELNSFKGWTWDHHREWCRQGDIKALANMVTRGIFLIKDRLINLGLLIIKVQEVGSILNIWVSLECMGLQTINKNQVWLVPPSEVEHLVIENTILIFKLINKALLWTNQLVSCLLY